ncbi:MAG TPA: DUF2935 domain-containing protein, partial [Chondromyces sp.]|nr:DUF2935 domain-containing protein [Chondromyces sp.]
MSSYLESAIFEHGFWLQILGDHARFIHDSLSPKEKARIQEADNYRQTFDALLARARQIRRTEEAVQLAEEAKRVSEKLRNYKLSIIRMQLENRISIHLTPTFINHMVNELEEYLRILDYLRKGQ